MSYRGMTIHINDTLYEVMSSLGFDELTCTKFQEKYANTNQLAYGSWFDGSQQYITIDMCVEIPVQCCEPVTHGG